VLEVNNAKFQTNITDHDGVKGSPDAELLLDNFEKDCVGRCIALLPLSHTLSMHFLERLN